MSLLDIFDTESKSESGAWLHLKNPATKQPVYLDNDPDLPVRIRLKGPESRTWKKFLMKASREKDEGRRELDDIALQDAQLYAAMTMEWDNLPGADGEPAVFSRDLAVEVYRKHADLRNQMFRFIAERENFLESAPEA